ncbi:hypothetical protein COPR103792_02785 [Corynebacterium propinquum]
MINTDRILFSSVSLCATVIYYNHHSDIPPNQQRNYSFYDFFGGLTTPCVLLPRGVGACSA